MFDLTTPDGVRAYLEDTSFAASNVETLSGGSANFTYRITLRQPYVAPGLALPINTLIMKHAQSYVAAWKDIPFSVERQEYEGLALKLVPELVRSPSIISLPTLYQEDRRNRVLLMTDCGPKSPTLKALLQSGALSEEQARLIGYALGEFIAQLHTVTRNPAPGTPAQTAKNAFSGNHQAHSTLAAFFFGRIVPTLTDEPPLVLPPILLSSETRMKLEEFVLKAQERVRSDKEVFVMGDFWGGNMLVELEPTPHITIIDWEGARPGYPGLDLGPFLAELHLLQVFHPSSRRCVEVLIAGFLSAYRAIVLEDGNRVDAEKRLSEIAHDTATHLGNHLIGLTPQVPWGGPELTRQVVQEGVEYILRAVDEDQDWLRGSIVLVFQFVLHPSMESHRHGEGDFLQRLTYASDRRPSRSHAFHYIPRLHVCCIGVYENAIYWRPCPSLMIGLRYRRVSIKEV